MLVQNFSAAQSAATPQNITLSDTSTGSDGAVVSRRIYITDYAGNAVVPAGTTTAYIVWAIANSTITVNVLTKDMALNVRVDWVDAGGAALYTLTQVYCFSLFTKQFIYSLTQYQALNPQIVQDNVYFGNFSKIFTYLRGAILAVELATDISASQSQLNAAYQMIINEAKYF